MRGAERTKGLKMKKFINAILTIVLAVCVGSIAFGIGYVGNSIYKNSEETQVKLEELYQQNLLLLNNIEVEGIISLIRDKMIVDKMKEYNQQPSYEYLKSATVRLIGRKKVDDIRGWMGTGIVVKITEDFTYILTNKHIAPIGTIVNISHGRKMYQTEILKNSAFNDLSLIRMNGKLYGKKTVKGFSNPKTQERIYSVGQYLTNNFIYSEGTIAGISRTNKLIVNLPSSKGCSGSGIFNSKGEVVGLLFGSYMINIFSPDTSKALCVPVLAIRVFLEEIL